MTRAQQRPRWGSVTSELDVTAGPPRRLLASLCPLLSEVQADYRESVGPIRVPRGPANPGILGTAFGVWVELQAWPRPTLSLASVSAFAAGPGIGVAFGQLLDRLGSESPTGDGPVEGAWIGPSADLTDRDLLRLCWAAACMIEVYRTGTVMPARRWRCCPPTARTTLLPWPRLAPSTSCRTWSSWPANGCCLGCARSRRPARPGWSRSLPGARRCRPMPT